MNGICDIDDHNLNESDHDYILFFSNENEIRDIITVPTRSGKNNLL